MPKIKIKHQVTKLCPVCQKREGLLHPVFGLLPCGVCKARRDKQSLPANQVVELAGEQIKRERNEYAASILQPFNSAGDFSREYYEAFGTKGVKVSKKQIKNAKYIWDGVISKNFDVKKSK